MWSFFFYPIPALILIFTQRVNNWKKWHNEKGES